MFLIAQIALGVIIAAAEPTGTLTLACQGVGTLTNVTTKDASRKPISMDTIVNFTDRTVRFGGDWPLPIPIQDVTETTVMFADRHTDGIVIGIIELGTGDMEAVTGTLGELENYYSLHCTPTQRMF